MTGNEIRDVLGCADAALTGQLSHGIVDGVRDAAHNLTPLTFVWLGHAATFHRDYQIAAQARRIRLKIVQTPGISQAAFAQGQGTTPPSCCQRLVGE